MRRHRSSTGRGHSGGPNETSARIDQSCGTYGSSDMHSIPMSNATGEAPSGNETTTISLPVEIWFRNGTMAP